MCSRTHRGPATAFCVRLSPQTPGRSSLCDLSKDMQRRGAGTFPAHVVPPLEDGGALGEKGSGDSALQALGFCHKALPPRAHIPQPPPLSYNLLGDRERSLGHYLRALQCPAGQEVGEMLGTQQSWADSPYKRPADAPRPQHELWPRNAVGLFFFFF